MTREAGWLQRDFRDDAAAPRRLLERRAVAGAVIVVSFFVFLAAIQHQDTNCGQDCYDGPLRTYEPGHRWTSYGGAWQWDAQWLMALAGLVLAIVAFVVAGRYTLRRSAALLTLAAATLSGSWIAWVILQPPTA